MWIVFVDILTNLDLLVFFFFNDTATTEIYTLSLHDALPIFTANGIASYFLANSLVTIEKESTGNHPLELLVLTSAHFLFCVRSEEHTSELQSRQYLVCRLLLEKKKKSKS